MSNWNLKHARKKEYPASRDFSYHHEERDDMRDLYSQGKEGTKYLIRLNVKRWKPGSNFSERAGSQANEYFVVL